MIDLEKLPFKTVLHIAKDISGLTLHEISEKTGIHMSQIKRYFSEDEYYPSPIALVDICKALNSTLPIEWQLVRVQEHSNFSGYFETTKELTDVINELTKSLEDRYISGLERRRLIKETEEAIQALTALKEHLMAGDEK